MENLLSVPTGHRKNETYLLDAGWGCGDERPLPQSERQLLAAVEFGRQSVPATATPCLTARVPLQPLLNAPGREIWYSNRPVQRSTRDGIDLAWDGVALFGCLSQLDHGKDPEQCSQDAFQKIIETVRSQGYPILVRMWSYLPRINDPDETGLERYRAFCKGRHHAFMATHGYRETWLPAGTGIGCRGSEFVVLFLALKQGSIANIENPHQIPAYQYPERYGPRAPSFARATAVSWHEEAGSIYVSGTSSILGHETLHAGNVEKQCLQTLDNIESLLSSSNLARYGIHRRVSLPDLRNVKVYLRHEEDLPLVQSLCEDRLQEGKPILYLNADICRADLKVEIEGKISWTPAAGS